jgi:hypothetical protein
MKSATNQATLPGLEVLEQTPIILEKLVSLATEEQLQWKPSMERWSISEVLAHLADVEVAAFRERVERMVQTDMPQLATYDQDEQYKAGRYTGGKAREYLKTFCHERDRSVTWLRYMPESILGRKGQHEKFGQITVGHLLNEWAFHDLGHIRQIAELFRARAFYPAMGPFQNFYTVKP